MANFDQLKQSVAALIRTNGAEEITGQIMQDVLLTIINSISGGYMFGGVAQHNGNVGNPDYNVFYLAGSGAYTGYGGAITIEAGCYGVFRYNGVWTQEVVDIGVRLSGSIAPGETRGVTGDVINTALQTLFNNVMNILDTLTFTYNTPSAQQATKAMLDVIMTPTGGAPHVLTTLTLASATAAAAGLMSAEDKQKVDRMLTDFRSLSLTDTTAAADQATKIVQTLSATLGENPEAITTFTLLAATASKAGLMSAADKAMLDCLVAMIGYYECSTAAGTAAKTVSASGYALTNGGCIRIKMNNANTASNVTLNINGRGAKALYYDGAQASSSNTWEAGEVLEVYYDGTQYQCASGGGGKFASGEKVKDTSITDEVTENSTALLESGAVYPMKYDMEQAENTAPLQNVSFEQGSTYNTDGTDATDTKVIRTNYLDVTGVSSITLASTLPTGYTLSIKPTWYNSSRALLQTPSWSAQSNQPITVNVPSGAAYLRLVVAGYNNGTQFSLTPASATTYSFILRPFESDSRWYGLLQKCKVLNEIDDVPEKNSTRFVESGGIFDVLFDMQKVEVQGNTLTSCGAIIRSSDNKWLSSSSTNNNAALIDVTQHIGKECRIIKGTNNGIAYAFLTAGVTLNAVAQFASGYTGSVHSDNDVTTIIVPPDAVYLYAYLNSSSTIYAPSKIIFGIDDFNRRLERCEQAAEEIDSFAPVVAEVETIEGKIDNAEGILSPLAGLTYEQGSTYNTDGSDASSENSIRTSYIDVTSYEQLYVAAYNLPSGYTYMIKPTWYTNNYALLETPVWSQEGTKFTIDVPSGAYYLRVVFSLFEGSTQRQLTPLSVDLYNIVLGDGLSPWFHLLDKVNNNDANDAFRKSNPYQLKVASYNIGHFSHGGKDSDITASTYNEKLAGYKSLINNSLNADIIGLCEYSAIFGKNTDNVDVYAKDVLFTRYGFQFANFIQLNYSCNAMYSRYYIENVTRRIYECNRNAVITHTTAFKASDCYYIESDMWMSGRKVKLIMTHLAFDLNNPQIVANQIAELITVFADEERVVLMGDWNVASFDQFTPFVNAGYTLGNDGTMMTYPDTGPNKALDNIIVKGMELSNVGVVQTSGLSDHLPIYATITLP